MTCVHHWQIERPNGATVRGICKRCGEQRLFPTSSDYDAWYGEGAGLHCGRRTTTTAAERHDTGSAPPRR